MALGSSERRGRVPSIPPDTDQRDPDPARRRVLAQNTRCVLADLGGDADGVAASLLRAGVRGRKASLTDCPVARYLNAVLGGESQVRRIVVSDRTVVLQRTRWWARGVKVALPSPVRHFVADFDAGRFAGLDLAPAG